MTEQADDGRALLIQANDMPYGEARTLLTERALRAAEHRADHELVFDVVHELISVYRYGGEPAKSLSSFARLVSEFDAGHGEPAEWAAHAVRWYYKWAISLLLEYPEFSLERIFGVLDDMERRYTEQGQSLHAVYQMRYRVAAHLDDSEQTDRWYAKWTASPADENADCKGCSPNSRVAYLVKRGRDEDAIELASPVLQGRLHCREQPHGILTSLLFAYARTGRSDGAVDAHRRAYRVHRGEASDLGQIGTHVRFCALTGNEPRGLEIVERHLPWLDRFTTPDDVFDFATDVALLLGRLPRDTAVRTTGVRVGSESQELADRTEAGELADRLVAWANEVAARFDERNGNTGYTDSIARTLAREPLVEHLPLTPHSRPTRGTQAASPSGSAGESVAPGETGGDSAVGAMTSGVSRVPEITESDPAALLDLAEEHWWNGRWRQAIACWRRFDEVTPSDQQTPLMHARRLEGRGSEASDNGDPAGAREFFEAAQSILADTGSDARWWAVEGLIAQSLSDDGDPHGAVDRLRTVVASLEDAGEQRLRGAATVRLARCLALAGEYDEARSLTEATASDPDPAVRGRALALQAKLLATRGEFSEALSWVDRAVDQARALGSERMYTLLGTRVSILMDLEDSTEVDESTVRAGLDAYVASAVEPHERASAHVNRGRWLLRRDDPEAAMPDLAEAVAELTALGARHAEFWIDLGEAYLRSERPMDAAEVLEEAIVLVRDGHVGFENEDSVSNPAGDPELTFAMRRARYLTARAKIALDENADAIEDLEALARAEETLGDRAQAGVISEEWATQLSKVDRDDEAADRFDAAAEHFASVDDVGGQVRCLRKRGLCIYYGPDEDEALPVFDRARTLLAERGSELNEDGVVAERAMLDLYTARTLDVLGRVDEAHACAEAAIAGFEKLGLRDGIDEARGYLRDDEPDAATQPDDEDVRHDGDGDGTANPDR